MNLSQKELTEMRSSNAGLGCNIYSRHSKKENTLGNCLAALGTALVSDI